MVASGTPWLWSVTSSRAGHAVAAMRRRRSANASSETSTRKGRIAAVSEAMPSPLIGGRQCRVGLHPRTSPVPRFSAQADAHPHHVARRDAVLFEAGRVALFGGEEVGLDVREAKAEP